MEAYSLDLRERVVAACDEGVLTRSEIAEDFGVSVSFITKLLRRRKEAGTVEAKPHSGGLASAVDGPALDALADLVRRQPDATLAELRDGLAERRGVSVSVPVVCRALARLGLPRKKSRRTRRSGTRRG
jgi:transposase